MGVQGVMCRHVRAGGHVPACARRWAYGEPGWARIAALAPAVLQCAEEGDSVAFRIVTGAANEAVRAAVTVAERSRLKGHRFKLVLSGARSDVSCGVRSCLCVSFLVLLGTPL